MQMKIIRCRVAIIDVQQNVNDIDVDSLFEHWDATAAAIATEDGLFVYEYDAPSGWVVEVGHGVLFLKDWCRDGAVIRFQTQDEAGSWSEVF